MCGPLAPLSRVRRRRFVHGDFGRTLPSIGSLLGCEADILQLDVMGLLEQQ
jgi:tRNA U54 and U55 pseudouridine synthase Pus10